MRKMNIGIIIGVIIMLFGLSMILNVIFHIHIPVFRIALAIFFIWIGIKMLTGSAGCKRNMHYVDSNSVVFGNNTFTYQPGKNNYSVVFGNAVLDLSNVTDSTVLTDDISISTVFGESKVILPDSIPVVVHSDAAFGEVKLPDRTAAAFGSVEYRSPVFDHSRQELHLRTSTVFGSTKVTLGK
jgi:predicted membrane protein